MTRSNVSSLVLVAVLSLFFASASPAPASAQVTQSEEIADSEARGLFLAGQAAFEGARFEDALRYFRQAYAASPRPMLLFNIGVAADRLRRDEEALEAFEQFLRETPPDAPQRRDAEGRVVALRAAIERTRTTAAPEGEAATGEAVTGEAVTGDAGAAQAVPGAPAETTPASPSGGDAAIGPWIVIGGSAAVAVAGAVLLAVGRVEADRVEGSPAGTPWVEVSGSAQNAEPMTIAGIALLSAGLAGASAGVLWLALGSEDESSAAVRVGLSPFGASVSGAF